MRSGPKGDGMIIGVSRDSIQRNVIPTLYKILGFPLPTSKTMQATLYGRTIYFVGAHDESSVRKIQGSTLAFAYVDEATCIPEPFWKMLLSRLSITGSQLFATCNPEGPGHFIKKNFIDRAHELDLISWSFTLDDNPALSEEYKNNLKKEYSGTWFARYILGQWTVAHGLVYDSYSFQNLYSKPQNNPNYYIMGIDYGTTNPTAAVIIAVTPHQWPQLRVEQEFYYDSAVRGRSKTDEELVQDLKEFIGYKNMSAIYIDPAAASLKIALRQSDLPVIDAKNDVILGIKIVSKFLSNLNLLIHESCKTLIEQIQTYAWDPKAADRGEDKPINKDNHQVDALRYCLASAFPQGTFNNPDENLTVEQLKRKIYESDFNSDFYGQHGAGGYR